MNSGEASLINHIDNTWTRYLAFLNKFQGGEFVLPLPKRMRSMRISKSMQRNSK